MQAVRCVYSFPVLWQNMGVTQWFQLGVKSRLGRCDGFNGLAGRAESR
jgi:hypothetical protein